MKKSDIQAGCCYSNGKGRIRKVLDMGEEYKLYAGAQAEMGVRYEVITDGSKKNLTRGERHNMSLQAFASWCKEPSDGESMPVHPAIAYKDKLGRGFDSGVYDRNWFQKELPYIEKGFEDEAAARKRAQEMEREGLRNIHIFWMPDEERLVPEEVTWEYVKNRLADGAI